MPEVNLVFPTPIWTNKLGLSTISRLKIIDFLESVAGKKAKICMEDLMGRNTTVIDLLSCPELTEVADLIHNNMESFVHEFLGVMDERHSLRRSDSWSTKQMMGDAVMNITIVIVSSQEFTILPYLKILESTCTLLPCILHGKQMSMSMTLQN